MAADRLADVQRQVAADVQQHVSQVVVASQADAPLAVTQVVLVAAVAVVPVALPVSQAAVANRADARLAATQVALVAAVAVVPVVLPVSQAAVANRADAVVATPDVLAVAAVPVVLLVNRAAVAKLADAVVATPGVLAVAVADAVLLANQAADVKLLRAAVQLPVAVLQAAVRLAARSDAVFLIASNPAWLAVHDCSAVADQAVDQAAADVHRAADVQWLSQAAAARSSQRNVSPRSHWVRG